MKTAIKVLLLGLTLAAGATVLTLIVRMDSAHAEKSAAAATPTKAPIKAPPAKMDALEAAQLDAALAHLNAAEAALKPYRDTVARLGQKYQVTQGDSIDFQTGIITRVQQVQAPQMAQAAPPKATPKAEAPKAPAKQ